MYRWSEQCWDTSTVLFFSLPPPGSTSYLLSFSALEFIDEDADALIAASMPDAMVDKADRNACCSGWTPGVVVPWVKIGETGEKAGAPPGEAGETTFGDPPPPVLPAIIALDGCSA